MHRRVPAARERVVAVLATFVASIASTTTAATATSDPLQSDECRHALAELSAQEAAVAETSRANGGVTANDRRLIDARLAPMRRQAARACLARRADPTTLSSERLMRPTPVTTQPLAVAPASSPAPTPATGRAAPLAPPTTPADKPYAITSCDAGGCWANDGSRLNRVGPNLWGSRGACTVQGTLLHCP